MKIIDLINSKRKVLISDIDECLCELEWSLFYYNSDKPKIAHFKDNGQFLYLHRHIASAMLMKELPKGWAVRLLDNNLFNHQRDNLHITRIRRHKYQNKTGYIGVKSYGDKYHAYLNRNYLGSFGTAEEAHLHYIKCLHESEKDLNE